MPSSEMRSYILTSILAFCLSAGSACASQVCSPTSCLEGTSQSLLLASDDSSHTCLVPGTYPSSSSVSASSLSLTSSTNLSFSSTAGALVVSPPAYPIAFTSARYEGRGPAWTAASWTGGDWRSVHLPEGWYGLLSSGQMLWATIPDSGQLPSSVTSHSFTGAGLSACDPPCASGGVCTPSSSNSTAATCTCKSGWSGSACDTCAPGFWGASCSTCPGNCSSCDEGFLGTGICMGTNTTSAQSCNCLYGTCTSSGDCICSAGYVSDTPSASQKCASCVVGFYGDADDDCLACPLGCTACTLQEGTPDTPTCTSCVSGLSLSSANPITCLASTGNCADGQYWAAASGSCQSCSPACTTCTGASTTQCLACTPPRVNLAGSCVGYDASTGVCDSSLSGLDGAFIVNNAKNECDACPVGCLTCTIPSFSSAASYSALICQSCQEGYLLEAGSCVKTCSDGYYLPSGSAGTNGTSETCDPTCASCIGTSTTCTRCSSTSLVASNGSCINSCPSGALNVNGTCQACSADCATCSTPGSASSCLTCPSNRPVLSNGRCIEYCPLSSYFDITSSTCKPCDTSCSSCVAAESSQCTSCPDDYLLQLGSCVAASCGKGGFVPGLGLCLSDLVTKLNTNWAAFAAIAVVLPLFALGFWLYVRRERRKTREATKDFGQALDERGASQQMMVLRLERVLGLNRTSTAAPAAEVRPERERKRLRELLLPSRSRAESIPLAERKIEKSANDRRDRHWVTPPPPYVPSYYNPASTIATPAEIDDPECKTKIVSMSSPATPDFAPRALYPPPRPRVGTGAEREVVREGGLNELWPAMGSPSLTDGLAREDGKSWRMEHTWI